MQDSLSELLRARFGVDSEVPERLENDPVLCRIAAQTSHRHFTDEQVDEGLLQALLMCALCAPAKSDLQQVAVIRVADKGKRSAIAALIPSMPWIGTAPEFLVFAGDNRRIRRICARSGTPYANDHLDSFFNAAVDCALVMMNFIVAVQAAGLGCCPVSAVRNHARAVADLLEMPAHVFPVAGMALGHPKYGPRITPRLSPAATVHTDRYDDGRFDDMIDEYDRRRHQRMPIAPERQRRTEEFGVAEFYGWSEDKARQVSTSEREAFGTFVREQAFKLT